MHRMTKWTPAPADRRRSRRGRARRQPGRAAFASSRDRVDRRRLGLAAQDALAARAQAGAVALQRPAGRLRAEDPVARLLRELLDAGGDVDRVADQRELELAAAADVAGEHAARVDADADPHPAAEGLVDAAVDLAGGGEGA